MTIAYEPSDFNEVTVVLRWRGTIFPAVLGRPVIWLLMAIHCGLLYLHMEHPEIGWVRAADGSPIGLPLLPGKALTLPNGLLTFFLVFYSGNCYSRYYALYDKCTGMAGCVMCWVGQLRVYFPKSSQDTLWNLSRHLLASVYLMYFQLAGGASDGGCRITSGEWEVLAENNMLTDAEQKILSEYRGFRPFLLQVWAMKSMANHLESSADKVAGAALAPFQAQALTLRGHCSGIVNALAQPVPFPYYHTVSLMLSVNLVLIAWSLTEFSTIMTIPAYFVIALVTLGLKETAVALSDPFGSDAVDFETNSFTAAILANTKALLAYSEPKPSELPFPGRMRA